MKTWYFYTQTGKDSWTPVIADDREKFIAENRPEFATVLDLDQTWGKGEARPANVSYRGPLFIDWDGAGAIQDVLDSVKRFMNRLESKNFDLNMARWYLSGNKGVHCMIPEECFNSEASLKQMRQNGVPQLPTIYRMMVSDESLLTEHMDLSIYSLGKGRMWRCPNHPRTLSDGRVTYKVQVTPDELRSMDEAGYWTMVSNPRPELLTAKPERCNTLAVEFTRIMQATMDKLKTNRRTKSERVDFTDWEGTPPTIADAFKGKNINHNLSLNTLKLQLTTAAVALGFNTFDKEGAFIEACRGFIQSRVGIAGAAHQTEADIEQVLRNCFRSVVQNPCYEYRANLFSEILVPEARTNLDLYGMHTGDSDREARIAQNLLDICDKVKPDDMGVIELGKETQRNITNYSWKKGSLLRILSETGLVMAYSVIPLVDGSERPRQVIPVAVSMDQKRMYQHILQLGAYYENKTTGLYSQIQQAWLQYVKDESAVEALAIALPTEGVVCQLTSDPEDGVADCMNIGWLAPDGYTDGVRGEVVSKSPEIPIYVDANNPSGRYGVDIHKVNTLLSDNPGHYQTAVQFLLELNGNTFSLAALLGWFTACLLKHPLYTMRYIENFPLLQVYGDAGCGKTTTMNLMLRMFTYQNSFRVNSAGSGITPAALRSMATGTTSIPLVIDEVKAQNLGNSSWLYEFRQFLQNAYTIGGQIRKAGGRSQNDHHNGLVDDPMFAPVAFMGETLETSQTSLMERIVPVGFHTTDKYGRQNYADYLTRNPKSMSVLGWTLIHEVINTKPQDLAELYMLSMKQCRDRLASEGLADRTVQNAAMVLTGFKFFAQTVRKHLGEMFDHKLEAFESTLMTPLNWGHRIESEAVRLVDFLAMTSNDGEEIRIKAIKGQHYFLEVEEHPTQGFTQITTIDVDKCYTLYRERMRMIGEQAVYTSASEMYHTLANSNLAYEPVNTLEVPRGLKLDPVQLALQSVRPFRK